MKNMDWSAMALVGRIARAHGRRGQVIVNVESDFPEERFRPDATLFVNRGGVVTALTLTTVRFQHDRPVVGIAGVETMNDAEALAGCELRVPVDELAGLPSGTFYRHDLIGCHVQTGAGIAVGVVQDVEGSLNMSRLVVQSADGEVLIPLVTAICTNIDVAAKRIVIDPPAGLLELNRS
jgi:16S rRNA processing protein RimM